MPDHSHDPLAPPPPDRRLTGWKEIAAYLDKSVRTVQRWERDFGLPVRRMGGDRLESVFAFAGELDLWLASASAARARGLPENEAGDAVPLAASDAGPAQPPLPGVLRPTSVLTWLLAALVVVVGAAGAWQQFRTGPVRPGRPTSWRVDGDTLVVLDARGGTVFSHVFSVPLSGSSYSSSGPESDRLVGLDDLDGNGRLELWFVARARRASAETDQALFVFNDDGTVRWSYRFSGTIRFGHQDFTAPWHPGYVFVTDSPDGNGARALWATSTERVDFPCVLQRLDVTTGKPLSTYWSNGYITSLALYEMKGAPVVLVGAAYNDAKASSLAVLDALNPNGSAPAVRDKYRCMDCPAGTPRSFVVFPKPARFGTLDESGATWEIDSRQPGAIVARVLHRQSDAGAAIAIYRLDDDLVPTEADTSDNYQAVYESQVRNLAIPPHVPAAVDPEREFLPILHWINGKFVPVGKRAP